MFGLLAFSGFFAGTSGSLSIKGLFLAGFWLMLKVLYADCLVCFKTGNLLPLSSSSEFSKSIDAAELSSISRGSI